MSMGDRLVVILSAAASSRSAHRRISYRSPGNAFVASFIGQANFIDGRIERGGAPFVAASGLSIVCAPSAADARCLMVRPEAIELVADATLTSGVNVFPASVEVVTYLGSMSELTLRLASGDMITITQPAGSGAPATPIPAQHLRGRIDPSSAVAMAPG